MEGPQMSEEEMEAEEEVVEAEIAEGGGHTQDHVPALAQEIVILAVTVVAQDHQGDHVAVHVTAEVAAAAEIKNFLEASSKAYQADIIADQRCLNAVQFNDMSFEKVNIIVLSESATSG